MGSIVTKRDTRPTPCWTGNRHHVVTQNSEYSVTSDEPTFQAFRATMNGQAEISISGDPEWTSPHSWIKNEINIKAEAVTAFLATLGIVTLAIVGVLSVRAAKRRRQKRQQ
jgi:hypothetical protein